MTKTEVAQLVALAIANFPSYQDRDLRITAQLWFGALSDLPYPVAEAAVLQVLSTSSFWPTVAQIRQAAETIDPHNSLPSPELAWEEVLRQIARVGYYGTPNWSNEAIGRAAYALYGGWKQLCQSCGISSMPADRAHFNQIYTALTETERRETQLPPRVRALIGEFTRNRLTSGEQ